MKKPTVWDRFRAFFSPPVLKLRNYEAASYGRRTEGWARSSADANRVLKLAGRELRMHARDLVRNVGWARRGQRVIANNTVSWGFAAKAVDATPKFVEAWKKWSGKTLCDADGKLNFTGLQNLIMRHLVTDGEVLIRRRSRRPEDNLPLPLQLQVLECDFLDTSKDEMLGSAGGKIVQGVEFDKLGRVAAYWLFPEHPGGSGFKQIVSKRIPADEIFHVFDVERAGQSRGVSWLAAAIVNLKDLDEYEDAELMKQKIAACFAAFVTDDGSGAATAEQHPDREDEETIEPGAIIKLPDGKQVTTASPPQVTDSSFTTRNLRKVASSLGVTYEDLTGDYSQVNFSSARMGRLVHQGYVTNWQNNLMLPFCDWVWAQANDAAVLAGLQPEPVAATWTVPALPMLEPDKEALANVRRVRGGMATFSEIVREQGHDPDEFFAEYAADRDRLRESDIWLESDVERVSAAGQAQQTASETPPPSAEPPPKKGERSETVEVRTSFTRETFVAQMRSKS